MAIKKGAHVQWNTSQGKTSGRVEEVVKSKTKVGATELKGSKEDPVWIVESDKTGKKAGHKESALTEK